MPLRLLLQLGMRNLVRHRRRSLMLLAAISVAVAGVTVSNSLIRGFQYDMRESAIANLTGDFKILAPGYRDDPGIARSFTLGEDWQPAVDPAQVAGWAPRIRVPAVIISERETRGVQLVGIAPEREHISFLADVAVTGERLESGADGRLLVGRELADQLQTGVGYRLVIITQGADGRNREAGFRIAGLYDAEGTGLERAFVFTGMQWLQELLDTGNVTEVSVRLTESATALAPALQRFLAAPVPGLEVLHWQQLEPQVAALFAFADLAIFFWFLILMGALVFGLVNTLVTAVLERIQELGMLRALGMRPGPVVVQVVLESSLVMFAGVFAGLVLGSGLVVLLADGIDLSRWAEGVAISGGSTLLVPRLLASDLLLVAAMSLVLGVLASIYPAWRAVRIKPLEALGR